VIYREMKKNADLGLLQNYLLDSVVDFSPNPLNLFQKLRITATDKSILAHVDGKRTIRDIGRLAASHEGVNPLKVVYALLEARFLKITEPYEAVAPPEVADTHEPGKKENGPFHDDIEQRYAEYKKLDYYRILGVQHDDSAEAIQKAYFRAERKYHPDMHQMIDTDVKKKLVEIFNSLRNAYLTLSDREKRQEYDDAVEKTREKENIAPEVRTGTPTVQEDNRQTESDGGLNTHGTIFADNSEVAKLRFRDGKVAFWENDFAKAARLFAIALSCDASVSEYHYMYGRALENLGKYKEAVRALNRANELKPFDPDTLAELGHLYLRMGFPLRADGYFSQVIKIDPLNKRVQEGIRVMGRKKQYKR
jgi:curved DNA-binding protein CbpA